jgi:hypothetical protein
MWIYAQHPKFGKLPDGARLDTIKRSPNYSDDGFQNLIPTPMFVRLNRNIGSPCVFEDPVHEARAQ